MRRFVLSFILLTMGFSLMAQNVTVTGRVNRPDALMRLMVFDDLLNMHETQVAETTADGKGFFILEGQVNQTLPASIYVGLECVDLVVTPNASYEVSIAIPDVEPNASYFDRPSPAMRVKTATDKGVYRQLVNSEQIINDYVMNYFDELFHRRQSRYLDSIKAAVNAETDVKNEFVMQQNTYKLASIQMALNADGGQKVIKEYFDGMPVLYNCMAYMDLFKDLFKNFEVTEEFKSRNPRLAELITIYHLRTEYYNEIPRLRGAVKKQIQAFKTRSKYPETQQMITNMLIRFDRFAPGAPAVDFELADASGNKVKLSDFKDKVVVLQFVEGTSRTVEHQFEVLADLHYQWQDQVQLITITTKDQLSSHRKRFEEHRYDWPLLKLGNDILLLEQYEVRTFPEYFIINKGTKIGMAPAPSPDQTLQDYVQSILEKTF